MSSSVYPSLLPSPRPTWTEQPAHLGHIPAGGPAKEDGAGEGSTWPLSRLQKAGSFPAKWENGGLCGEAGETTGGCSTEGSRPSRGAAWGHQAGWGGTEGHQARRGGR